MKPIEVRHLTRKYNGFYAVQDLTFNVDSGEIFGFLGPNGAGKTTTIKLLTGQLRPTAGKATVLGCDVVQDRQDLKPQIGVVFEYQNVYERLSAFDNLIFYARLYGIDYARVAQVLAYVGLTDRANQRIKQYSNGMKQRLLIGRALLHDPKVLFLDEPTRGLDPGAARDIRELIVHLAEQGVTIFLTTHYMEEADRLCHRVAIIDKGRIVALDEPEVLKACVRRNGSITLEDAFLHITGNSFSSDPGILTHEDFYG